jgi:hypothetical protein
MKKYKMIGCLPFLCIGFFSSFVFSDITAFSKLAEPDKWFSLPFVGISTIEAGTDCIEVQNKGTVAYKNRLEFEELNFDLNFSFDGEQDKVFLLQFNKQYRDSSINQHHLIDNSTRAYGLAFYKNCRVQIVKTKDGAYEHVLMDINEPVDFSLLKKISLRQNKTEDGKLNITVSIGQKGKEYSVSDAIEEGYSSGGFIGMTIYEGRTKVKLSDISFKGKEVATNLGVKPRPVYFGDFFDEGNRKLVHWSYDNTTTDYDFVRIEDGSGKLLDMVKYPQDFWIVPQNVNADKINLTTVNIDGHASEAVSILTKDDHKEYYSTKPQERIAVRKGEPYAEFIEKDSNKPFVLKGFNYVRLRFGEHVNFEAQTVHYPSFYDSYETETVMKTLKKHGFNTLRVFIVGRTACDPGIAGDYEKTQGVYGPYMDNFIDFLKRAKKYGLYIYPAMCDGELPLNRYYLKLVDEIMNKISEPLFNGCWHNALYLTTEGLEAKKQYIRDFLGYIKNKDPNLFTTFLAIECQNELYWNAKQWPFKLEEGIVKGANGKEYDMSKDLDRQNMFDEGVNFYHAQMVETIKSVEPNLLVGEGFYTPRIVDKDPNVNFGLRMKGCPNPGFPPGINIIGRGPLDFLDIHIYHVKKDDTVDSGFKKDFASSNFYAPEMAGILKNKPFILGEYGSFKFIADTFEKAKKDIIETKELARKAGARGQMMWTLDTFEQRMLWHAVEDNGSFLDELAKFEPIETCESKK